MIVIFFENYVYFNFVDLLYFYVMIKVLFFKIGIGNIYYFIKQYCCDLLFDGQ